MIPSNAAAGSPQSKSVQQSTRRSGNEQQNEIVASHVERLLPLLVLTIGFAARFVEAGRYFLNPDEALHTLLASQPSVGLAYRAALTNAHPPLLILVLYYWRALGQSEVTLRLSSILAGTAFCWIAYQWLIKVTDRSTAFIGLLTFAFSPTLIGLSAEIRQYSLLLFFMAGCLFLSERAIRDNSLLSMILFSLSLYGALLTHYSSLFFALVLGIYMLARLYPYRQTIGLFLTWGAGQIGGLALSVYFLETHVKRLRQSGMIQSVYDAYVRKSIFHPGDEHAVNFAAVQTLRVFTYLFSHGVVGSMALLAFLAGIVILLRGKSSRSNRSPSPRELALLIAIPFVLTCAAALAGIYPYGGTRHDAFLALFAVSGACIGLSGIGSDRSRSGGSRFVRRWTIPLAVAVALALCNFFPAPPPPIRARNHSRRLMNEAMDALRHSAPPGSVVLADYQSALLLGYYACGHGVVQEFPPFTEYAKYDCGSYQVVSVYPGEWKFYADDFPRRLSDITTSYGLAAGSTVWLFEAGWITDSAPALLARLQGLGCSEPLSFGQNIFLCRLTVGADAR